MDLVAKEPRIDDAFGCVLARCWEADAVPWSAVELIERDDGLIGANDASRYFSEPRQWSALERWAWEQAEGRILDVGCGGGRHAVAWVARGQEVVGVDPSPGAVRITGERGAKAVVGSVPSLPEELGGFDTIALCGGSLGLLGGPEQASQILSGLAVVARPGARLIGTGTDPGDSAGTVHADYHSWNLSRGRARGQLRLRVRDGAVATPWFDYWLASPDEFIAAVDGSAWTLETLDRELTGSDYAVTLRI